MDFNSEEYKNYLAQQKAINDEAEKNSRAQYDMRTENIPGAQFAAGLGAALAGKSPDQSALYFNGLRQQAQNEMENSSKKNKEILDSYLKQKLMESNQAKYQQDLDFKNKQLDQQAIQNELNRNFKEALLNKTFDQKNNRPGQDFRNLPEDDQEVVKGLSKKNADKIAISNSIDSVMNNWDQLDENQKLQQGRQLIKVLNSTQGQDAVGAEEAKRLAGKLEFAVGNLTNSNPIQFGRDLKGFHDDAVITSNAIKDSYKMNNQEIAKRYNKSGASIRNETQIQGLKSNSFPKQIRKDGHVATVNSEKELKEALSEGWQ